MKDFSSILSDWYLKNRRDLPWRSLSDPYPIWLCEIILQQTRVDQGLPYWNRFLEAFPTVIDLAKAEESQILRLWQGLGYYSRARNLHTAAKQILEFHGGIFPSDYVSIRNLKGVGDYTAAAVASFAFNLPYAVVDGNVYRFLSRYFGIRTPIDSSAGKKEFALLANELLDKKQPDTHNQAMMEMGAIICKPSGPLCNVCPFASSCHSLKTNEVLTLPVKTKTVKVVNRYFQFVLIHTQKHVLIKRRGSNDIWQGLYDFPLIESSKTLSVEEVLNSELINDLAGKKFNVRRKSRSIKHQLSHQTIYAVFYWIEVNEFPNTLKMDTFIKVLFSELDNYGMPQLIVKYLEQDKY